MNDKHFSKSAYSYQRYLIKTLNDNGLDGEEQAAQILADAGFIVYFDRTHETLATDLFVYPGIGVEVKASKLRNVNQKARGFQFNLYKHGRSKRISEPVTMLVCQTNTRNVPFIIPSDLVKHHSCLTIAHPNPYAYKHKWSHFRERFDFLEAAGAIRVERGFVTDDKNLFENLAVRE